MVCCSKATNEMNYTAQKFTRVVMGGNNVDSCNRAIALDTLPASSV